MIRVRHSEFRLWRIGRPTSILGLLLAVGALFTLPAPSRGPRPAVATDRHRLVPIVVNCLPGTVPGDGQVTFADALARAAADLRDNIIEFDPAVFSSGPVVIPLAAPLWRNSAAGGHDHIDGTAVPGGLILDASACPDAGIVLGGDARLTLTGLTVRGARQRGVLVTGQARLALQDVIVRDSGGPGLALFGESQAVISRGAFLHNGTHGLEVHGRSAAVIDSLQLNRNVQAGAAGFDQANIIATECIIEANSDWSVILSGESRGEFVQCTLRGGGFANVDLSRSASIVLRDAILEDGGRFGVFATGRSSVTILGTTLRRHASRGIELQDHASLLLRNSQVEANADYGLILFGESTVNAIQSLIRDNGAHGVSIRGLASGRFTDCVFTGNRYSGIGCLDAQDGGPVLVSRCLFRNNGMRPIYRGPLHIDPLVPTPLSIQNQVVTGLADPGAVIELFLDRAGEADRYLKSIRADARGLFRVDCRELPPGWVMTATATWANATSEFNVIAGSVPGPVLDALLARTGPLSDDGGDVKLDTLLRRWPPGTHLVFSLSPPSPAVERYARFLVERVRDWTGGSITASIRIISSAQQSSPGLAHPDAAEPDGTVVIPVRYVSGDAPHLLGRGGVTLMKWDASGYFLPPMEILLALPADPAESCPRVLAHELGHTLGLCHTRVGLLSRMQGSPPPTGAFINDFSPMLTYYDVLALQILHDPQHAPGLTLRDVVESGAIPRLTGPQMAYLPSGAETAQPSFSPSSDSRPPPPSPARSSDGERGAPVGR